MCHHVDELDGPTLLPSQIEAAHPYLDELALQQASKKQGEILTEGKDKIGSIKTSDKRSPSGDSDSIMPSRTKKIMIITDRKLARLSLSLSFPRVPRTKLFFGHYPDRRVHTLLRLCFWVRVYKWTTFVSPPAENYSHPTNDHGESSS